MVLMVFFSSRISPFTSTVILRQIATGNRGSNLRDIAHLSGKIGRKRIHIVGEILPSATNARHDRLAATVHLCQPRALPA